MPEAFHQSLDSVEHGVQIAGELVELVICAAGGNAAVQIAAHDVAAGLVDGLDPPGGTAAHRDAAGERQGKGDGDAPDHRIDDHVPGPLQFTDFTPHQKIQAALKHETPRACEMRPAVRRIAVEQFEGNPSIVVRCRCGPAAEIADERPARRIGEKIDCPPARVLAHPLVDDRGDSAHPSLFEPPNRSM